MEQYSITYYKLPLSRCYRVKVQNTKTYEYVKDLEVYNKDSIGDVIENLKNSYSPSYVCEVYY